VTLNVCLGKQFSGGELFFRGVRCEKHVNVETQPEVIICPLVIVHVESLYSDRKSCFHYFLFIKRSSILSYFRFFHVVVIVLLKVVACHSPLQ